MRPDRVHRAADQQELERVGGRQLFVNAVVCGELESDLRHILAEQCYPSSAIGLFQMTAGRQRRATVEDADIVEAKKAALEQAPAIAVLAIDPPAEIRRQAAEHPL